MNRRELLALLAAGAMTMTSRPAHARASRPLVAYLSRSGNTRAVAEIIAAQTGGNLFTIEPKPPYPRNYQANVDAAAKELEQGGAHPIARLPNLAAYDRIYLGWPTWAMQMPPPVQTFLRQADLHGKTVIPFNTHAGWGAGDGFQTLQRLAPHSRILAGFSTEGGYERRGILLAIKGERRAAVEREVREWLRRLGQAA
ncbi:flavodoxin [Eikenella sp. S3360]|uniref:Flavodoxin n=1 Tax=Eikenella glucosivorans TaxID=2766967 RepID=A0ABS0N9H3_9NEIS|nr:flavodoxin [Eikenella glucosivorans]MBH5328953.1 flavodoxin [Eikenella glucosivorans]